MADDNAVSIVRECPRIPERICTLIAGYSEPPPIQICTGRVPHSSPGVVYIANGGTPHPVAGRRRRPYRGGNDQFRNVWDRLFARWLKMGDEPSAIMCRDRLDDGYGASRRFIMRGSDDASITPDASNHRACPKKAIDGELMAQLM